MGEDTRLVNIYLKIHNKQPLFLDDLRYLAKYDPECFEKTCKNVVYNIPETKTIMEPVVSEEKTEEQETNFASREKESWFHKKKVEKQKAKDDARRVIKPDIEAILDNLKRLEREEFPVSDMDADKVKNLLGNLFMEQIFPHNDKDTFMEMQPGKQKSFFDKKI